MPDPGSTVLFDYWRSSASYRVRIGLALKQVNYERVPINLVAGEQRARAHLAINPQGTVPVLKIDGITMTQSLAILEYLDETRPDPPLLPRDPAGRAKARALALAVACEIHPLCNLGVLERIQELAGPDKRGAWNRDTIARGLAAVDAMLDHPGFSGRFCLGGTAGLADCVLVPQLYNATRWGVSFDHLPRLGAVARACAKHPAFAVAHPDNFDPARSGGGT